MTSFVRATGFAAAAALSLSMGTGLAAAADMAMPVKAAPIVAAPPSPFDIAFGAALTSDYNFRGITQSAHKPSVNAYFEPRYNILPNVQLYTGVAGNSISFPNRAAAEVDIYGGIRPTFGPIAFDFGGWYYWYPGGVSQCAVGCAYPVLPNGNITKADFSFFEVYGKALYTVNDMWAFGANVNYSPSFLNTGAPGTYASGTVKFTAPTFSNGIGLYVSGEFGRQWLGTSDAFYGNTKFADYNTWNAGLGFTFKTFTLDMRYFGTDLNRGDCNAFTGDHTAALLSPSYVTAANPGGIGSNWCDQRFIAKGSFDLTYQGNIK